MRKISLSLHSQKFFVNGLKWEKKMLENAFDIFLNLLGVDVIFLACMNQDL